MSAYIVDKLHVQYLVEAAMSRRIGGGCFYWCWGNPTLSSKLDCADKDTAAQIANMLWCENIKSVSTRYPNESSATLPGPTARDFTVQARDFNGVRWLQFSAVQVIKACDCYAYQTCEHDEWETSEAKAFIDALRSSAWHELPGYDEAEWGAPAVYENAKNVVCLTDLIKR
jgi:hypothetical protein